MAKKKPTIKTKLTGRIILRSGEALAEGLRGAGFADVDVPQAGDTMLME
jgi:hypothetical protein